MKHLRIPAILLLIVYSALVIGMNFHSHDREQRVSVHCKICDFSHASALQPAQVHAITPGDALGTVPAPAPVVCPLDLSRVPGGRSPPSA